MKLAICAETEAELARLGEIADALGTQAERIGSASQAGEWPDRFSAALLAAEAEIAALAPDAVLVAGEGPAALAGALAATRAVVPLVRLAGEDAAPADRIATAVIGAAATAEQAAAEVRAIVAAPPAASPNT